MFWVKFEGTPQMGVLLGVKMVALSGVKMGTFSGLNLRVPLKWGILLVAPKPYLLPLLPFYLRDFLYSLTFYSLTSIFEFTSEKSEIERTCK